MDTVDFVPPGFTPPRSLATAQFLLEPLGPQHNQSDYAAWTSSIDHIHATPGWADSTWPDGRSIDDNRRDLERRAADFERRRGFTFTVLDPSTSAVIGCVYIYPAKSNPRRARVLSWVTESRAELDAPLWRAVSAWLQADWPFPEVEYAERVTPDA